jgi:hypothetical protein
MGALPGAQQSARYIDIAGVRIHRTVPFVNNHDTYRPQFNLLGNITGWNSGDELSAHVEIYEPRLAPAYAVMCAMDGNPQVFFEDLLNVANTGKRFSHLPTNTADLPANQDIINIMKAHGALNFKGGAYKVPSNVASFYNNVTASNNNDDVLVIERSGKAIIAATDNWNTDQDVWIDTDFPVGTVLQDYSGGIATTTTVLGPDPGCAGSSCPNRVRILTKAVNHPSMAYSTAYADHGAHYHGYSIWAPVGQDLNAYSNPAIPTTQEWEMENDLGDSHCRSLRQGGRTPDNSPNARVVGKIFVNAGENVSYLVALGTPGTGLIVEFYNLNGDLLHSANGSTATLSGAFTNSATGWVVAKVRNALSSTPGQKCWVRLTYHAPASVNTTAFPAASPVYIWAGLQSAAWSDCRNWEEGRVPACTSMVIIPHAVQFFPVVDPCFAGTLVDRTGTLPVNLLGFKATSVAVFPNPTGQSAALQIDQDGEADAEMRIFNAQNQLVAHHMLALTKGLNTYSLPVENLPAGVYVVSIRWGSEQHRVKMHKL